MAKMRTKYSITCGVACSVGRDGQLRPTTHRWTRGTPRDHVRCACGWDTLLPHPDEKVSPTLQSVAERDADSDE